MKRHYPIPVLLAALTLGLSACQQDEETTPSASSRHHIVATADTPAQRTAVGAAEEGGVVGIVWTEGDQIGAFDATGTAQTAYTKLGAETEGKAAFAAQGTPLSEPLYAYYPYNAANDTRSVTSLLGTLPATQSMDAGRLVGDYKIGRLAESTTEGHRFVFAHLFCLGRIVVDATGTVLNGEQLLGVSISATRGGSPVVLAGDFTFSAYDGSWRATGTSATSVELTWSADAAPTLAGSQTAYASFFPNVKQGDEVTVEVRTTNHRATFTTPALVDFERENIYTFPVTLSAYDGLAIYDAEGNLVGGAPQTGTFTCATLNVDGLPSIINSGGPGSSGTTQMGSIINNLGWDFVGVSENFEYNDQLVAAMSNYSHGTYRGTVSLTGSDTDGLGFFWRSSVSVAGESCTAYNDEIGGLTGGANTLISKGFRHYEVTVATGMTVDVYITHMNTWSDSNPTEYEAVQIAQLCQLRDAVVAAAKTNNRPAIIMGDTNMRYTRHAIKTNFFDAVAAEGLVANDPWLALQRGGTYPTYPSLSLMIRSKYKGDTTNDICCSDDQRGEVVDKIWYINVPGAPLQLKATSCENDVAHFTKSTESASYTEVTIEDASGNVLEGQDVSFTRSVGYADHFPVVATFEYTFTPAE